MAAAFTVYVVDDEEAVRDSLSVLLETHGFSVRCFATAQDFLDSVSLLESGCVLVDIQMPGLDGLGLLREVSVREIKLPVVMMTGFGQVSTAVAAMKAGAIDFLEKPLSEQQLLEVLTRVTSNLATLTQTSQRQIEARARLDRLTPREREIFDRLVLGKQNKMIAVDLQISPRTVELHRARIMEKLSAGNLSDLVRLALLLENRHDQP
jgi:two-component system response regulator FixJ